MYKKFPMVIGRRIRGMFSICSCNHNTANPPRNAVRAETTFHSNALPREKPLCNNTAKSPISWGISCKAMATVVAMPSSILTKYEAAIKIPSVILCAPSPRSIIVPTGCVCLQLRLWQWCQWINFSIKKEMTIPSSIRVEDTCMLFVVSINSGKRWKNTLANKAPTAKLTKYISALRKSDSCRLKRKTPENEMRLTAVILIKIANGIVIVKRSKWNTHQ